MVYNEHCLIQYTTRKLHVINFYLVNIYLYDFFKSDFCIHLVNGAPNLPGDQARKQGVSLDSSLIIHPIHPCHQPSTYPFIHPSIHPPSHLLVKARSHRWYSINISYNSQLFPMPTSASPVQVFLSAFSPPSSAGGASDPSNFPAKKPSIIFSCQGHKNLNSSARYTGSFMICLLGHI